MGDEAAGVYSVAVDFTSQTLTLLMLVINMAVFPVAVRAWENHGREAAQEKMRANASYLMAIGVPCVVGMALLAPGVAHAFLGKGYRISAAHIIPLVALGTFLANFKAFHFDAAFQFAHRTIYQVWIVLFVAVVNIGLNLIAIPHWGINGAVGASVVAYMISIGLTAWLGRRHFSLPFPFVAAAQVLLAAGTMALALLPVRGYLGGLAMVGQIALGMAVYGMALVATNFLGMRRLLLQKMRPAFTAEVTGPAAENSAAQLVEVQ
jgi:O-antigen/teichoic acid export membrane protein